MNEHVKDKISKLHHNICSGFALWGISLWFGCDRFNSSLPGQNGCHLEDDNFKCIFLNENDRIPVANFTEICSQESN